MGNYSSPDIAVHISELSQRMHDPTAMCQELLNGLCRYKELTINEERRLQPNVDQVSDQGEIDLFLMGDANLGIHRDKCRARAGVLAFLADVLVCWQSKLEPGQSAATAKSEFIGMANAARTGLWIDSLVIDISQGRYFIKKPIICAADNQAAITIAKSAALTKMARHIDIRWMWVRDLVKMEILNFIFTRSKKNTSDSMTKVQGKPDFVRCRDELYGQMFGSHEKVVMSMQEIKGDWQVQTLDQILNLEEEDPTFHSIPRAMIQGWRQ